MSIDYTVLSRGNYVLKSQIPQIMKNLLENNIIQFPIKMHVINYDGKRDDYVQYNTIERMIKNYNKSIENNSNFLQERIVSINIQSLKGKKLVNRQIRQRAFGAGSETYQIPEFNDEMIYIPANPSEDACLLNCVINGIKESGILELDALIQEVRMMFRKFIGDKKISKG